MYNKIVILLIALAIIFSPQASAEQYNNDAQQTAHVVIDDNTAPIDSQTKPDTENKEVSITFTRKTDSASEKATLNKKEKKQTIRGLFTLGGFNKDEKDKNKKKVVKIRNIV